MGRFRILAAAAVLALVAVACSSNDNTPSSGGTTPAGSNTPNAPLTNKGTFDATATTEKLEIELDNEDTDEFYFKPTFIRVKSGQILTLDLKNEGSLPHTFTATALGIDKTIEAGEETDVNVTVPAGAGADIQFFCKFHADRGMRGAFFFGSAPQASGGSGGSSDGGRTTY